MKYTLIFAVHEGKVLVYDKSNGPEAAQGLNVPGGKVEPGEGAATCADREFEEEVEGVSLVGEKTLFCTSDFDNGVTIYSYAVKARPTIDPPTIDGYPAQWVSPQEPNLNWAADAQKLSMCATLYIHEV